MKWGRRNLYRRTARMLLCATAMSTSAQGVSWLPPGDGAWNLASNWSSGLVPGSADSVIFPDAQNFSTISLQGNGFASSLRFLGGSFYGRAISGGTLNLASGEILVDPAAFANIESAIQGTAGLTKSGNGYLSLSGSLGYSGATRVNEGTLQISNSDIPGTSLSVSQFATLSAFGSARLTSLEGSGSLSLFGELELTENGFGSYSGPVSLGSFRKKGSGQFNYSQFNMSGFGSNSNLGNVTVEAGTLSVSGPFGFGGSPSGINLNSATIASGATLSASNASIFNLHGSGNLNIMGAVGVGGGTFNGGIDGFGTMTVNSQLVLGGSNAASTASFFNLSIQSFNFGSIQYGGSLSIEHDDALPPVTIVDSAGFAPVYLNGHKQRIRGASGARFMLGGGTLEMGDNTNVFGIQPGGFDVSGPGTLRVAAGSHTLNSAFDLDRLMVSGSLQVNQFSSFNTRLIMQGGTLTQSGGSATPSITFRSIEGTGRINLANGLTVQGNGSTSFSGQIETGSQGFTLMGGGTLRLRGSTISNNSGNPSPGGSLSYITESTLILDGSSINGNGAIYLNNGTLLLRNGSNLLSSFINGNGTVNLGTVDSPGQIYSSGQGTFHGSITGAGTINLFVNSSYTLSGEQTFAGNFDAGDGSNLNIASLGANFTNATITSTGSINVFGELRVAGLTARNVMVGSKLTVDLTGSQENASINGNLSGIGTIVKKSGGVLAVNGALDAFNGAFDAQGGTLLISNASTGSLSSATFHTASGATMAFGRDMTIGNLSGDGFFEARSLRIIGAGTATDFAGVISGSGTLELGLNTTFRSPQEYTGIAKVSNKLSLRDAGALHPDLAVMLNAATFDTGTLGQTVGSLEGTGKVLAGGTISIGANNQSTQLFAQIIASNDFIKSGTGTLRLRDGGAGTNTFNGGLTVQNGTLSIETPSIIVGSVRVRDEGTGDPILQIDADNRLGGPAIPLMLAGGTLRATGSFATNRPITLGDGANGSGTISVADAMTFTVGSGITGLTGLTKAGLGTLKLTASNSYAGSTRIREGTLLLNGSGGLPLQSVFTIESGGALDLGGVARRVGSLAGAGTVALGSASLTFGSNGAFTTFAGALVGGGGVVKEGEGQSILTGTNTFGGGLTVNAGTIVLSTASQSFAGGIRINDGLLRFAGTGALGNSTQSISLSGGTLQSAGNVALTQPILLAAASAAIDVTGANILNTTAQISGGGILRKSGTGTLRTDINNSFAGILKLETEGGTVSLHSTNGAMNAASQIQIARASTLLLDSSVQNNSARIGNGATITFNGGTLLLRGRAAGISTEIAGPLLLASGAASIELIPGAGGSASISFASLTRPISGGASLDILGVNMGTTTRVLLQTGVNNATLPSWLKVNGVVAKYDVNAGYVVRSFPLPGPLAGVLWGDANLDGFVDGFDYSVVMENFNAPTSLWSEGDFNEDGFVTQGDLNLLMGNLPVNAVVPEPASLAVLIAPVVGFRRTRKNGR